jgi:polyhydroxyalkanoate synthesis regulator phasin
MELLDKAEKSTADLRKKFSSEAQKAGKSVSRMTSGFNWATQDDLRKLERKVNRLAKQVKEMQAQAESKA